MRQISILNTGDKLSRELFGNITLAPKLLISDKVMEETIIEISEVNNNMNKSICKLVDLIRFPYADWYKVIELTWSVYNVGAIALAENPNTPPIWSGIVADLCGLADREDKMHTVMHEKLGLIADDTELAVYVYQKQ